MSYRYDTYLTCSDVVFVLFTVLVSFLLCVLTLCSRVCSCSLNVVEDAGQTSRSVCCTIFVVVLFVLSCLDQHGYCDGYSVRGIGTLVSDG